MHVAESVPGEMRGKPNRRTAADTTVGLNLIALAQAGIKTILLAVVIVSGTILLVYSLARRFGVDRHLAILVASGTGICSRLWLRRRTCGYFLPHNKKDDG